MITGIAVVTGYALVVLTLLGVCALIVNNSEEE